MTGRTTAAHITIRQIETEADFEAIRMLVREFFALGATLNPNAGDAATFAGLEKELADLPGRYGPPGGALVLVRMDGAPVGCGAFFDLGAGTVEIKRMYVRDAARGLGLGRRILTDLVERARALGRDKVVLSTYYKLETALALYADMGFQRCAPTEEVPPGYEDKVIFMDMTL